MSFAEFNKFNATRELGAEILMTGSSVSFSLMHLENKIADCRKLVNEVQLKL